MAMFRPREYVFRRIILAFVICWLNAATSSASVDYWPTEGWRYSVAENQGMDSGRLAKMVEFIQKKKYEIDNITVIRNGYVVLDAYFHPFQKDTKHIIHSCTKSITSALIGIAMAEGFIKNVTEPVLGFFPNLTPAESSASKRAITLEHLLIMAPGLKCQDSYRYGWRGLYEMQQSADWIQYMLDLPISEAPGTRFEYCNGATFLLSAIIQETTGMKTLEFAEKRLFSPLGIKDVKWRTNPQRIDIGYGGMWLKPHDMAKIGWLYLNQGRWENRQVVPAAWVEASTRGHISANLFDRYGYQWWVDSAGYYMAVGYRGQFIYVIPEKNMVVVFTSDLPGGRFHIPGTLLIKYIIPAATSSGRLSANPNAKAHLDAVLKRCATAPAYGTIWLSDKDGVAKDGVFMRTASPAFQFSFPIGSKKVPLDAPDVIMAMRTPEGIRFSATVVDIPEGWQLAEMGPKHYAANLTNVGTDIQIVSNNEIVLKDGTPAYRTDIKWMFQETIPIRTHLTSVFKDGKCIYVSAHPTWAHPEIVQIVESVTLETPR
ncbi:MAG: serine hydrolase [Desulfobacterales bacterium]|nr:MAG: serine hydrolase [Desulfobacterales bacterium]